VVQKNIRIKNKHIELDDRDAVAACIVDRFDLQTGTRLASG